MKRFHVNLNVADLRKSVDFYNTLFATEPTVLKSDYAKWMLDDPRINFAISQSDRSSEIQERLRAANQQTFDQPEAECCYAKSSKTWVRDPDQLAWETFVTHGQITHYGADVAPESKESRCCA
jgi:hypothetical protein